MARMLKQALKGIISDAEISEVYSAFDIIGDIAVIRIPDQLMPKKKEIAEAILNNVKPVKSVFVPSSPVSGDFRVRSLEWAAGENKTLTLHREHGCRFKVDVDKVYFSPRFSTERARIADMVGDGEVVVNMFAGVCVFSIIIARKRKCHVYSIDINPDAHSLCIENIKLNKVEDRITPMLGDASDIIARELRGKADRVIMPLPERAKEYIKPAVAALKAGGGMIHYFTHIGADSKKDAPKACAAEVEGIMKARYKLEGVRVVREVGPRFYQVVADLRIFK